MSKTTWELIGAALLGAFIYVDTKSLPAAFSAVAVIALLTEITRELRHIRRTLETIAEKLGRSSLIAL